jgi:hypothetical protein
VESITATNTIPTQPPVVHPKHYLATAKAARHAVTATQARTAAHTKVNTNPAVVPAMIHAVAEEVLRVHALLHIAATAFQTPT